MHNLMPCPFCNEEPSLEESINHGWYVGCCFGTFHADASGYDGCPESKLTPEEAITLWNTRPMRESSEQEKL